MRRWGETKEELNSNVTYTWVIITSRLVAALGKVSWRGGR